MSVTNQMMNNEKRFEGNVAFMYLDTRANVTVGVGKLLSSATVASALPFMKKSDNTAATPAATTAEWQSVHGLEAGRTPPYYDSRTTLRLLQPAIDTQLRSDLQTVENQLKGQFGKYENFPAKAQEGLVDMGFNLGVARLMREFPSFVAAVRVENWSTAANECHRQGVSAERNDFVADLFRQAAG